MRFTLSILVLPALALAQGCIGSAVALEAIGPKCTQEQIVVTWPATITRGESVTTSLLTHTLTQSNIARAEFDALRDALTSGSSGGNYHVKWELPAFDGSNGYIAFTHTVPLPAGEPAQVTSVFSDRGWGAAASLTAIAPAVSVHSGNFVATSANGTITVLAASPLRLRLDVTTSNASGETVRLAGDAGFFYDKVTALCN
jgi:hypothetical protein